MAIIKPSGTIADIRGKVGGAIFCNSGAGLVLRSFTSPVNRNTTSQNNQRQIIADLQQQWRSLTNIQRARWKRFTHMFAFKQNNFNRLPLGSQQTFIKINATRLLYGYSIINNPVFISSTLEPVSFAIYRFGSIMGIFASRSIDSTREFIELFCTYPLPPTINNPGTRYKAILFTTVDGTLNYITDEYIDIFGRLPTIGSGEKMFFRACVVDKLVGTKHSFRTYTRIF